MENKMISFNGEMVGLTGRTQNLGHGIEREVIYQDGSTGFENEKNLID